MSAAPQPGFSFDDWLAIERTATDQRSEYVDGEIFAMAGGTEEHNLIVLNVGAELRNQLKDRPCRVYPRDMKVHIAADDVGIYPDVMVICGERRFHDGRRDVVTNPTLIVEVLSDSTEAYDRGDKFRHFRSLRSLQAYLLLSQYRMQAELFLRQPDGTWSLSSYQDPSESIQLRVVEAELSLAEVYDKVELSR
ncbi:Uma2 family endonuclease [Thiocapsa rosea]|uniref:Uma2 family endonuclease n=1 Tax=Thiocapsa rosea TaxID=69360 RepID=A0A495V830_9GAMM|nr:Uma2 family endonuclease [Thiocapsa rosea]RKT45469.1 Uma2 family endonuclease [Thiocapsa rosea]